MEKLVTIPNLVVLVAVATAVVTDVRAFKIHNVVTFPLIVTGVAYHGVVGGWEGLWLSVAGMCVGAVIPLLMFLCGGMGAGDVKLMAGIGAWLGGWAATAIFATGSIVAGAYAVWLVVRHGRWHETANNFRHIFRRAKAAHAAPSPEKDLQLLLHRPDARGRFIPFSTMIAVALIARALW